MQITGPVTFPSYRATQRKKVLQNFLLRIHPAIGLTDFDPAKTSSRSKAGSLSGESLRGDRHQCGKVPWREESESKHTLV